MENNVKSNGDVIIYQSEDGATKINVNLQDETVWLSQQQLVELYHTSRTNVVEHIRNIYNEGELEEKQTCRNFRQVRIEGNREVNRSIPYYNLDMIISLGYRIKSLVATKFRIWATQRLKEYMIKGFVMDDERLKGNHGGSYWRELVDRIRDIRASEKVIFRQVLDLYATSVDFKPDSEESVMFYKIVQNKLHYAVHGRTAAEIIFERADSSKPFMGLTSFAGELPSVKDVSIAKNYLSEKELMILKNLVSGYFDLAEINAMEHKPMYMKDYIRMLDNLLRTGDRKVLSGAGTMSNDKAVEKAVAEYRKYQVNTLSPVEEAYLKTIKETLDMIE